MSEKINYPELFGEEGHLNEEGTALFVDALFLGKTSRLPGAIRDHVSSCERCRKEVTGLFDLVSENRALYPPVMHPVLDDVQEDLREGSFKNTPFDSRSKRFFSSWRIAASLLIVLCAGAAAIYYLTVDDKDAQIRQEIVGKIKPGEDLFFRAQEETLHYAVNQAVPPTSALNPKLEAMFNLQLRGVDFVLKSPQKVTTVRVMERISWEWQSKSLNHRLTLMIMDDSGINRNQISLTQKKYQFIVNLPPGLYYWVIVNEGELLSTGKIRVI